MPSLSARSEDVPLLVRHFLQKHGHFSGENPFSLSAEDVASLANRPWPGNVRELESTIKRWLALGKTGLGDRQSSSYGRRDQVTPVPPAPNNQGEDGGDREQIQAALERHQWNRRKAADDLGISYQTLRRRIEQYGLDRR